MPPISADTLAGQAMAVARALLDPQRVAAALTPSAAATLSDGLAGTALLHACLSHTGPEFATAAAHHWEAAARLCDRTPPDGIYTGPGGLAASLIIGSGYLPHTDRYRDTARRATAWLSARAQGLARHQQHRTQARRPGAPWAVYDTIRGLAGIGRVLLAAHTAGHQEAADPGLTAALTTLTALIRTQHGTRPGWWLPADEHPPTVTVHASGAATTGLAHGIAGPLAFLATAHLTGRTVPGQAEAIHTAASWLLTWQEPAASWPTSINGNDLDNPPTRRPHPRPPGRRDAWCYGTPGIGSALTLAGQALADPDLSRTGRTAITTLADRAPHQWDTDGPALCHGAAGVLQTASRTTCAAVAQQAAGHTVSFHDPGRPFGFPQTEAGTAYDNPGFLTGAAGTALALADYAGLLPPDPPAPWDCLLLLA
ncbi:lanthionine synthetase C family protein [Streptomyces sp. B1866]|uniref:lanthionine synthetase C family protein n=1 Tax=Streptomyces sp. B1866 TaxID=3075431 RepID=UPI00289258C4|nr:lanthionine synthetase C family protein [Streptomyces sp. B1866]MDT3395299.1 lanthionine synthetase C family protein [Streptomyces sp. B1866]